MKFGMGLLFWATIVITSLLVPAAGMAGSITMREGKTTPEFAKTLQEECGLPPGGIRLEGMAEVPGLGKLNALTLRGNPVVATLNGSVEYQTGLDRDGVKGLVDAIPKQDAVLAVSMGAKDQTIGDFEADSPLALDLFVGDMFLGSFVFNAGEIPMENYKQVEPYEFQSWAGDFEHRVAVYFSLNGFTFRLEGGQLAQAGGNMDCFLIPTERDKNGKPVPDYAAIELLKDKAVSGYYDNLRYVIRNQALYASEPILQKIAQYGALASLIRLARQDGAKVSVD